MFRAHVLGFAVALACCAAPAPSPATTPPEPTPELHEPEPEASVEPEPEPPETEPPSAGGHLTVDNPDPPKWQRDAKVPTITAHEVVVGTPAIDGDIIRRVVRSHHNAIRACYDLAPDSVLAGRIAISFTISPTGAVTEAKADTPESYPYPDVTRCIADEIRTWTFPVPRGGGSVIVSYPFNVDPV